MGLYTVGTNEAAIGYMAGKELLIVKANYIKLNHEITLLGTFGELCSKALSARTHTPMIKLRPKELN